MLSVGQAEIFTKLFREVVIPEKVRDELSRTHTPLPNWLRVVSIRDTQRAEKYAQIVDRGEAEAITLALELHADRLLIDERKGRRLAAQEGVAVIGLLGVVLLAKRKELVPSARMLLLSLEQEAGMYLREEIRDLALKSVGE